MHKRYPARGSALAVRVQQDTYIKSITDAELSICEEAGSFLQSAMWGEFKSRFGWSARAFLIEWTAGQRQEKSPLLVISRRFVSGFSFAYVPWGPELPHDFPAGKRHQGFWELAGKLKPFLLPANVFIRFDPPQIIGQNTQIDLGETALFESAGFRKAKAVQAPDTVIIDLCAPCDEIFAAMKPKWRYNILLAGKKGVTVELCGFQELGAFYSLLKETGARDGIAIHNFDYYKTLFEICSDRKSNGGGLDIRLYTAKHEGGMLAAIVVLFYRKCAVYLYGASSNIKRNLMAPYALQWRAMQDAKEAGCINYDLFGIPPDDNPNHPMAGLYRFKTGFGGKIIRRSESWDYPYKPLLYRLFILAESLHKFIRNKKKKKHA